MNAPTSAPDRQDVDWSRWFPELPDVAAVAELITRTSGGGAGPACDPAGGGSSPEAGRPLEVTGDPLVVTLLDCVPAEVRELAAVVEDAAAALRGAGVPFADPDAFLRDQLAQLLRPVSDVGLRVLVAELHRLREAGELSGRTPQERYDDFVAGLGRPGRRAGLLRRYPDLGPDLRRCVRRRATCLAEVLTGLAQDSAALEPLLGGPARRLRAVEFGAGDTHRGGRSVCTVSTEGGKVVFKPRSLRVDEAFARVVRRVAVGTGIELRSPAVVTRAGHGWAEFITSRTPDGPALESQYYRRLGALTAVLYFLDATDMHAENVVCDGEGPVVVDLETLLHGRLRTEPGYDAEAPTRHAVEALYRSVCGTGVLPLVLARGASTSEEGFDVGVAGFEGGALSPFRSLSLEDRGTDRMRVVLTRRPLLSDLGLPSFTADRDGRPRQVTEVVEGFSLVHDWVSRHREEFAEVVRDCFAGVESRFVHQPTLFYAQLLRMAGNPEVRAVPGGPRVLMNRVGLRLPDAPAALTRSEFDDLVEGDVPYFTTRADSLRVWDSRGADLGELLQDRPLAGVLEKISAAGPADLERQTHLLHLAFINKYRDVPEVGYLDRTPPRTAPGAVQRRREHLGTALEIGDDLLRHRFTGTDPRFPSTWIGPLVSSTSSRLWRLGTLGYDLYGGTSGLALFLAALSRVAGTTRHGDAARQVLHPVAEQLPVLLEEGLVASTGAFGGLPGTLYALDRAGRLLEDPDLVSAAARHAPAVAELVSGAGPDGLDDLVTGSAGALACLLALHRHAAPEQREPLRAAASSVGEHLLTHHALLGGDPGRRPGPAFTGFAHGTAGVHPYLLALHRITQDERHAAAAAELLRWEDAQFDPGSGNWLVEAGGTSTSHAWCHGAGGILLSRSLRLRAGDGDPAVLHGALTALAALRRGGLGHGLGHCHGDSGTLEVLDLAADVLHDRDLAREAAAGRDRLWDGVLRTAVTDPADKYAMTRSLMVGLPGAGYSLLRSLEPATVPAFLWLD